MKYGFNVLLIHLKRVAKTWWNVFLSPDYLSVFPFPGFNSILYYVILQHNKVSIPEEFKYQRITTIGINAYHPVKIYLVYIPDFPVSKDLSKIHGELARFAFPF